MGIAQDPMGFVPGQDGAASGSIVEESGESKGGQEFMSAVCNRRARPNTKLVSYADPRA